MRYMFLNQYSGNILLLIFYRFLLAQIYFASLDDKLTIIIIKKALKQFQK
jgi:hypothetical protein